MKKLLLVILILAAVSAAAFAQARKGQFGAQVGAAITSTGASPTGVLGAKYMITDNIAVRLLLGLANTTAGGVTTTGYDLLGAFEYHFTGKGGVSPYVGAELGYSGESVSTGGTTPNEFAVNAVFGAEYFFSSNFAWGGEMRIGYFSATLPTITTLQTSVETLLTWYIN